MSGRVLAYEAGQLLVEYGDGSRFNLPVAQLVDQHDPARPRPQQAPHPAGEPRAVLGATRYFFETGDELAEHSHDAATVHDIRVERGRVTVRREISGDVDAAAGEVVTIAVGEHHSVKALEPSITLHVLVG